MLEPNGGLTAPAPNVGLASARRPRSVNRRQTPRGKKIERAVAEQSRARSARDGATPAPSVDPGFSRIAERTQGVVPPAAQVSRASSAPARGPAVGEGVNADIGAQLSRRVSSGAIDISQAKQVASDRMVLERAYGPKWREKVFGSPKGARGLPSYGYAGGSEVNSLRSAALKRAKAKLAE